MPSNRHQHVAVAVDDLQLRAVGRAAAEGGRQRRMALQLSRQRQRAGAASPRRWNHWNGSGSGSGLPLPTQMVLLLVVCMLSLATQAAASAANTGSAGARGGGAVSLVTALGAVRKQAKETQKLILKMENGFASMRSQIQLFQDSGLSAQKIGSMKRRSQALMAATGRFRSAVDDAEDVAVAAAHAAEAVMDVRELARSKVDKSRIEARKGDLKMANAYMSMAIEFFTSRENQLLKVQESAISTSRNLHKNQASIQELAAVLKEDAVALEQAAEENKVGFWTGLGRAFGAQVIVQFAAEQLFGEAGGAVAGMVAGGYVNDKDDAHNVLMDQGVNQFQLIGTQATQLNTAVRVFTKQGVDAIDSVVSTNTKVLRHLRRIQSLLESAAAEIAKGASVNGRAIDEIMAEYSRVFNSIEALYQ